MYSEFYLPGYYNPAVNTLKKSGLIVEPNEVEKYILASIQYHKGSFGESTTEKIVQAINSHDYNLLVKAVNSKYKFDKERGDKLKIFINKNKTYIYKDVN